MSQQYIFPKQEQKLIFKNDQPSNIVLVSKEITKIEHESLKCAMRQYPDGVKDTYCTLEKTTYHLEERMRGF